MTAVPVRRFPWIGYGVALALIVFIAALPLISVFLTYLIADANGCRVDEGSVHPCVVMGVDIGGLLYTMGVLGWLMLASLPLGALAVIAWLAVLIVHYLARRFAGTKSEIDK